MLTQLASSVLFALTNVFTLMYLGWTFKVPKSIDPQDWKRKWIIFFAWFSIAVMALFSVAGLGLPLIVFAVPILTSIFTLVYLGSSFDPPSSIDPQDWKRKWIIFFAWLAIASQAAGLLYLL
jgi:hypothetical protein